MIEETHRKVLLIHGAWHGGWCWRKHWVPFLEERGFECEAIDLIDHDRPGDLGRIWPTIPQQVAHVAAALDRMGPDTIIVGHSMGGYIVQRVLEKRSAAHAVLVASVPRHGVGKVALGTLRNDPRIFFRASLLMDMSGFVTDDEHVRGAFFTADTPDEIVSNTRAQLQNESFRSYLSLLFRLPRPKRVSTPVTVVAAEFDPLFDVAGQQDLAEAYSSEAIVIEGAGHDLMLDPRWQQAAEVVAALR